MSVIKICGLTRQEDALVAVQQGADFLGLIFHRASKRYVSTEQAAALTRAVKAADWGAKWMGVFVDESVATILEVVETVGLDGVQLHGSTNADAASSLRGQGVFVIAGHTIAGRKDLAKLKDVDADVHLLDAYVPGSQGGTGVTFDWSLAALAAQQHRILLAGGLTPDNVARAIHIVGPWGVDVSSGVEVSPGLKDAIKIKQFMTATRTAFGVQGGRDG